MNRKPYSSAIKKTPFKYPIAKKIAKLMLDGLDRIDPLCLENLTDSSIYLMIS